MCVFVFVCLYLSKFLWQSDTQIDTQRTHPHSIYATSITATVKWANPFQFPWSTANAKFHFYLMEACVGAKLIVTSLKAIFQIQSGLLKNGQTLYSGQRIYKWFYPYDSFFFSLFVFNNIIQLSLVDFCFLKMVRISSHQIHCLLPITNSEYKYFNRCFFSSLVLKWNNNKKSSWKTGTTQRLNYFC